MTSEDRQPRRWLKFTLIIGVLVLLTLVIVMMISGGGHGPARHFGAGALEWTR